MSEYLDIAEVAKATGLTSRALRFWEARGLVRPLRTASGRRAYGPDELARLNAIAALKRAGFSLTAIKALLGDRRADLARLVAAQIEELAARAAELEETRALLTAIQSRIGRREPVDVATLCSLIRKGTIMEEENWKKVTDRYISETGKADFAAAQARMPEGFDHEAYAAKWKDLGGRIAAAQPLDPASEEAGAFVREWFALLKPFTDVATPTMMQDVTRMYGNIDEWEAPADPGFSAETFSFIQQASKAHPQVARG
ncbi:MAG: MerR family transcriptional regulator [Sphingomonadales bacterium]|nr:MerR family transcriptional regulator [Sphingomonadales bacterium]MDE2567842.1 MerR family transcriptional regulator [Sphingomonadales bacterium]